MPTTFKTVLTTIGLAKIANATATGVPVALTHMAVGDGNGNPTTPSAAQTALVREVYRGALNQIDVDPNVENRVLAELSVPSDVGGWTVREVGLFDEDGNMCAVANFPETYKPQISEGAGRDLVIRIYMDVVNADAVELKVDPNVVIASRQWVVDNFSIAKLIPGGLTNQVLRKRSNGDGDTEWASPSGFNFVVTAMVEMQTLAENQTEVILAEVGTAGMALYIEGAREFDWTPTGPATFTLGRSYPPDTRIWCAQNDPLDEVDDASVRRGASNVKAAIDAIESKLLDITRVGIANTYVFAIGAQFNGTTAYPCISEVVASTNTATSRHATRTIIKNSAVSPGDGMGTYDSFSIADNSNGGFGYKELVKSGFKYRKGGSVKGGEYVIEVLDSNTGNWIPFYFNGNYALFPSLKADEIGSTRFPISKSDAVESINYLPNISNFIEVTFSNAGSVYIIGGMKTPKVDGAMVTVVGSHQLGYSYVLGVQAGEQGVPDGISRIIWPSHRSYSGLIKLSVQGTTIGGGTTTLRGAKMEFRYSENDNAWILISATVDSVTF